MDKIILAIETSCDETSMAVLKGEEILAHVINSQASFFETLGGVVPEMASRMHEKNIFAVYKEVLHKALICIDQVDYIAVTYGPGLVGPLLIGVNFANSLKLLYNIDVIPVNHMQAHIKAINIEHKIIYPHISLIVSGGHTEIVYLENENSFLLLGQTLDDAIGESYDKVARMLGLGYPGGPKIDVLSNGGESQYPMPSLMDDKSYNFSFSGIKSHCYNTINQMGMKNIDINVKNFAYSFQEAVLCIIVKKFAKAIEECEPKSFSVVGGVSANSRLKELINEKISGCLFASNIYCTDNAAMVGYCALEMVQKNYGKINAKPGIDVEEKWTI